MMITPNSNGTPNFTFVVVDVTVIVTILNEKNLLASVLFVSLSVPFAYLVLVVVVVVVNCTLGLCNASLIFTLRS